MNYIILLFGVLILLAGIILLIKPDVVFGLFRRHSDSSGLHILAVVVRLILGTVLIAYAAESKHPLVLEILGWISVLAAIIVAFMGRTRFKRLISWALSLPPSLVYISGMFAFFLGGFLIYAVV